MTYRCGFDLSQHQNRLDELKKTAEAPDLWSDRNYAQGVMKEISKLEGIIPAIETAHAFAWLEELCPTLPAGTEVILNCSGRGDKDVNTVAKNLNYMD